MYYSVIMRDKRELSPLAPNAPQLEKHGSVEDDPESRASCYCPPFKDDTTQLNYYLDPAVQTT